MDLLPQELLWKILRQAGQLKIYRCVNRAFNRAILSNVESIYCRAINLPSVSGMNLPCLTSINVCDAAPGLNVECLSKISNLRTLTLKKTGGPYVGQLLLTLPRLPLLKTAQLGQCDTDDIYTPNFFVEVDSFERWPALQELDLFWQTDHQITKLSNLQRLTKLSFHFNAMDIDLSTISTLSRLKDLTLFDCWIERFPAVTMPELTSLYFESQHFVTPNNNPGGADISQLACLSKLRHLTFLCYEQNFDKFSFRELSRLTSLRELRMSCIPSTIIPALQHLTLLQGLQVHEVELDEDFAKYMDVIRHLNSLQYCMIRDELLF